MKISVIGAGIGGLTAGLALRQKGFDVQIYERAPSFKAVGTGITIAANAMSVLGEFGLAEAVMAAGHPIESAHIGRPDGRAIAAVDVKKLSKKLGYTSVGIHRADLHDVLAAAFGHDEIGCDHELQSVETDSNHVVSRFANGATVESDLLVGADGLWSRVRSEVFGDSPVRNAEQFCWRGITEIDALSRPGSFDPSQAWELWGRGARFGYLQISAHQIYWYATMAENDAKFPTHDLDEFRRRFAPLWHAGVQDLLSATPDAAIVAAPLLDRLPSANWHTDRVVLLGDAIHSTTPNMGQGACMAIESAWALAHCLSQAEDSRAALARYQQIRAARTSAITTQSFRMGRLFQTDSALKAGIRDIVFSYTPAALQERALLRMLADTPMRLTSRMT